MYILFEHPTCFAFFLVKEFEETGLQLPQVEESVTNLSKFSSVVSFIAYKPFTSTADALRCVNEISEGMIPDRLSTLLEECLPKPKKRSKASLGVYDQKLAAEIHKEFGIPCVTSGVVPELLRGIRLHFTKLVKEVTKQHARAAQLGLGFNYSRNKVAINVNKNDNMIIQGIALLDQTEKNINTFSMRIREWYSYHYPELYKIVADNYIFAQLVDLIGNRSTYTDDKFEKVEEIVKDTAKAEWIRDTIKTSMGMELNEFDMLNIKHFTKKVVELSEFRMKLQTYLGTKMNNLAPNLATLIGDQVGARLISHAGSLSNLSKYPASTVQILGAEKALFRALKTRSNTPKYGLLFHSSFIGRAAPQNKGRISRYLANKCSIASRIDCFSVSETPQNVFGEKMKQQVEDRLKFYETGDIPAKNIDVMKEAIEKANSQAKAEKKDKKRKRKSEPVMQNGDNGETPKKKKKKIRKSE